MYFPGCAYLTKLFLMRALDRMGASAQSYAEGSEIPGGLVAFLGHSLGARIRTPGFSDHQLTPLLYQPWTLPGGQAVFMEELGPHF